MTMTPTPTLAEQRTALQRQQRDLRERLPALALQAAHGDAAAEAELARAEGTIAAAERQLERLDLAGRESARLDALDREQAAAERQRSLKAAYQAALSRRQVGYLTVEAATADLVERVRVALAAGDQLNGLASQTGHQATSYATRFEVAELVSTALAAVLPGLIQLTGRPRQRLADPLLEGSAR